LSDQDDEEEEGQGNSSVEAVEKSEMGMERDRRLDEEEGDK